jgi:hypothetical protein
VERFWQEPPHISSIQNLVSNLGEPHRALDTECWQVGLETISETQTGHK